MRDRGPLPSQAVMDELRKHVDNLDCTRFDVNAPDLDQTLDAIVTIAGGFARQRREWNADPNRGSGHSRK